MHVRVNYKLQNLKSLYIQTNTLNFPSGADNNYMRSSLDILSRPKP